MKRTIPLLSLLPLVTPQWAQATEPVKKPNVIIIYADDLGYGDLECYGAKNVKTPNVNKLAKEGIRFTNAHAVAATSTPSRYSLLTGEYAWRKPNTDVAAGNAGMIIRPTQYTISTKIILLINMQQKKAVLIQLLGSLRNTALLNKSL